MTFMDLAKARYSERYFDPRPVEQEKIDKILEAGRTRVRRLYAKYGAFVFHISTLR